MKILLVGEYSRLHNSLKEGLQALGHEVTLVSTGDKFKKYPSDVLLTRKFDTGLSKKFKVGIYKLFGEDITSYFLRKEFFSHKEKFKNFDVVQLINESSFSMAAKEEKKIISFLRKNNKKLFLLSCGSDYSSIKFAYEKKLRYSTLTPLFEGKAPEKDFASALKYLSPDFKALHKYIFEIMDGVITTDMDYHIPLKGQNKYLGLIANPINTALLKPLPLAIDGKIVIFHGINRPNYFKKGNDYFEAVLSRIQQKYASKVEIITVESLPYSEYISAYNSAHILLDQVLSYDQGYNALEAMAKGKVVFTGAETEWLDYYNVKEDEICINALPDVDYLFGKLEELILNPQKLIRISNNARKFIETEHDYVSVAKKYLATWDKDS